MQTSDGIFSSLHMCRCEASRRILKGWNCSSLSCTVCELVQNYNSELSYIQCIYYRPQSNCWPKLQDSLAQESFQRFRWHTELG